MTALWTCALLLAVAAPVAGAAEASSGSAPVPPRQGASADGGVDRGELAAGSGTRADAGPVSTSAPDGGRSRAGPPDAGVALALEGGAEPLRAPLGRIGDVVTPLPAEGISGDERALSQRLAGCDRLQTFWLSRFMLGSALAASQVSDWLKPQPRLRKRLFGKADPLTQAIRRARRAEFPRPEARCALDPASAGWRLLPAELDPAVCQEGSEALPAQLSFREQGKAAAVVRLSEPPSSSADRCRPRISALLVDDAGKPRFALHADYGGALEAEVFGDRCQTLLLRFDPARQHFVPRLEPTAGCPAKKRTRK